MLLKRTTLLQEGVEVRIYQNEEAVKGLLQAKRESPYILLIDESVPTAILFLLDAAHCTPKESPAAVSWF